MPFGQDKEILKEAFKHPMLRPKFRGNATVDPNSGALVYPTGDVVSPGSGEVLQIGSQAREYLSELPDNRRFKRLVERGEFKTNSPLGMLGAPGIGTNISSLSAPGGALGSEPDLGSSVSRIKREMEDEDDSEDFDERGRRKTFGMIGSGPMGMPSPGPLRADRMPFKDVLSSTAGVSNEALANIPGVTLSDGSRFNDGTLKEEEANLSPEQQMQQKMKQVQQMLQVTGGRSMSLDPESGKMSIGAAPRPAAAAAPKPPVNPFDNMSKPDLQNAMLKGNAQAFAGQMGGMAKAAMPMLQAAGMPMPSMGPQGPGAPMGPDGPAPQMPPMGPGGPPPALPGQPTAPPPMPPAMPTIQDVMARFPSLTPEQAQAVLAKAQQNMAG